MMSTSSFSNDMNVSGMMMDTHSLSGQDLDPNTSLLNTYLDTQVIQTLQMNNEIITINTPTPMPSTTETYSSNPQPYTSDKKSINIPQSVSTPPPLPNLPSSIPIIQDSTQDQEMKNNPSLSLPPLNLNLPYTISSKPFIYKHKNKGKFKSKKIFDTISKKSCYWPTWIKKKR